MFSSWDFTFNLCNYARVYYDGDKVNTLNLDDPRAEDAVRGRGIIDTGVAEIDNNGRVEGGVKGEGVEKDLFAVILTLRFGSRARCPIFFSCLEAEKCGNVVGILVNVPNCPSVLNTDKCRGYGGID
ncbi:hypothetical protein LOK49_LG07G00863 [Camellia lanceoleosa]|uniref:Uncharacterized protein n=1 Tax=Camellia lanceoleosa TaxID=1840588 RepID=A0ACC0H0E3_9ERIC|nr:hypothetical protein LOK49_LG07G00863 [Camellia lanceoleosa]